MNNSLDKIKKFLLDLFFPKFCLGCKKEGAYLCDDCRSILEISEFNYCLCDTKPARLPLEQKSVLPAGRQGKCNKCRDKKLSGLYFALPYNLPAGGQEKSLAKKLIYQFKYQPYLKDLAKTLASILIEHFIKTGKNTNEIWAPNGVPAFLIPVPLDKKKFKSRGYNQSEELAKELSKIIKIPVISDVLVKIKFTKPQMELKKEEREKNLQGAFVIKNPESIRDKKIFLVDDVYTTGSTMQECALALRGSGAKSVWGICLAREE